MAVLMEIVVCVISFSVVVGFDLTILHTNDVHARIMQFNRYGSECSPEDAMAGKCFGGVARRHTKIQEIRNSHDNVVLLDAGDQFMGTLWFTVYEGLAAAHFMEKLKYDVMCLGNHEFDLGVKGLVPFLKNVTFPVVSANTDVTREPRLHGLFNKSHVINVGGERIGVIGYITPETEYISTPGSTVEFTDISAAIRREVTALENQGVNKIIALGHAGYSMDQQVALIEGVDVVVGGHTDTFLYTGNIKHSGKTMVLSSGYMNHRQGTPPSHEKAMGHYPTIVEKSGGKIALVVQDFTWAKYLGYLNVTFDVNGDVTGYGGNPILLDASVAEDAAILNDVTMMRAEVDDLMQEKVGYTNVLLDGVRSNCRLRECNLGNLITDSTVAYHANFSHGPENWSPAAIAFINSGGIRASIDKGTITAGDIVSVMPFRNEVDMVTISGRNLLDNLELAVREYNLADPAGSFLQFSGLQVIYNMNRPVGRRVVSAHARCVQCAVPSYTPVEDGKEYNVYLSTFILGGGDGFDFKPIKHLKLNTLDSTTLVEYVRRHSPILASEERRIIFDTSLPDGEISGSESIFGTHMFPIICFVTFITVLLF